MPDNNDRRMYELEYPAPAVSSSASEESGPAMIVALHGYADAGLAVEASADHLKAALDNGLIASFNNDELIDYRSRRPVVTIDGDRPVEIEPVDIGMRVLRDTSGKSFLLLSGPEPDMRWEAFTNAVADLAEKFNVSNTVCLYAAPMPVPHTRPLVVTAHGNDKDLTQQMVRMDSTMIVPGSAALFLEKELDDRGCNVAGYTAHVPHYLANSPYPHATQKLLQSLSKSLDLELPLGSLEHDIERVNEQLAEQVDESPEIQQVVRGLEEQYDSFVERYRQDHPQAIMPGEDALPTGDEIGEELQRFLADLHSQEGKIEEILNEDIDDREDNFGDSSGGDSEKPSNPDSPDNPENPEETDGHADGTD